jgi:hypothetical protein
MVARRRLLKGKTSSITVAITILREDLMKIVRSCLLAAAFAVLPGIGSIAAQTPTSAQSPVASSSNEVSKTSKTKTWTRVRFEAAKKRWAENETKFAECQRQLKEQLKVSRLSLYRQVHFLERCMNQKP